MNAKCRILNKAWKNKKIFSVKCSNYPSSIIQFLFLSEKNLLDSLAYNWVVQLSAMILDKLNSWTRCPGAYTPNLIIYVKLEKMKCNIL